MADNIPTTVIEYTEIYHPLVETEEGIFGDDIEIIVRVDGEIDWLKTSYYQDFVYEIFNPVNSEKGEAPF